MFPAVREVAAAFADTGLAILDLQTVRERFTLSPAEGAELLRLRAISTFEHLSEREIAEGFGALDAAVQAGTLALLPEVTSDLLELGLMWPADNGTPVTLQVGINEAALQAR